MASLIGVIALGGLAIADEGRPPVHREDDRVVITVQAPGSPGSGGGSKVVSERTECTHKGTVVPCQSGQMWWHHGEECYVVPTVALDSHPDDRVCVAGDELALYRVVRLAADVVLPDPGQLARTAVSQMQLQPVRIATSPPTRQQDADGLTYVGWNTWLWNDSSDPASVGPISRSASAGGYTVTATTTVDRVVWDMGDGGSVTCGAGTPWDPALVHNEPSPDCGYVYEKDGEYTITATTHWTITWEGLGARGVITMETSDQATLVVAEAHMVNTAMDE